MRFDPNETKSFAMPARVLDDPEERRVQISFRVPAGLKLNRDAGEYGMTFQTAEPDETTYSFAPKQGTRASFLETNPAHNEVLEVSADHFVIRNLSWGHFAAVKLRELGGALVYCGAVGKNRDEVVAVLQMADTLALSPG
jgi:hypothetical protein